MARVSGLRRQLSRGAVEAPPDAMTPAEQLAAIRRGQLPLLQRKAKCRQEDLLPRLADSGIRVLNYEDLKGETAQAPQTSL
jgi:polyphosphate kinase